MRIHIEWRRRLAIGAAVLIAGPLAGCGSENTPVAAKPRLLTVQDLKKYPSGSAEAALLQHYFYIQWGGARNIIASLDPSITQDVGIAQIVAAYAFLRPALSAARLRVVGTQQTGQGPLVTFETFPASGPSQPDSVLLGKVDGTYVVRYDTQLERGIPGSIRAATAGEPQTKQYRTRIAREISQVLDRYHRATGAAGLESALERVGRDTGDKTR
jgi:hypothetical protein